MAACLKFAYLVAAYLVAAYLEAAYLEAACQKLVDLQFAAPGQ